jgi:hypothetical protein
VIPLALLRAVPLWVYPMAGLALWGGCGMVEKHRLVVQLKDQKAQVLQDLRDAEAVARLTEIALTEVNADVSKKLLASRKAVDSAAAGADSRLRELAAAWAASAPGPGSGAACRDDGAPAVALLPGEARGDLVALAKDAQTVSERLVICQDYVRKLKDQLK